MQGGKTSFGKLVSSENRIPFHAPVDTLRESGLECVGTRALDDVDEREGVHNDLRRRSNITFIIIPCEEVVGLGCLPK